MKLFEKYYNTVADSVLPYEKFKLFSDIGGFDLSRIDTDAREKWIAEAERFLNEPYPLLLASNFIRFHRDGNRTDYECVYFRRRDMVFVFALAEAIEGKGRFLDRIMDGIWLICDECDWVIPAHIYPRANPLTLWCKYEHPYMDLFAAETGATLALVDFLVGDRLDLISPLIRERLRFNVHERVTRVYTERDDPWWMGFKDGRKLNNWTTWITANTLTAVSVCETDASVREAVVSRAMIILDRFLDGYGADGGCDEGPSYWSHAGGSLFDCLELLYDMTGGTVDIFSEELVKNIGEYIADFHVEGSYFINFADARANIIPDYAMISRFGRRTGSKRLCAFGAEGMRRGEAVPEQEGTRVRDYTYSRPRKIKNMFEAVPETAESLQTAQAWYSDLGVMIERDEHLFLAIKGGHNNESHNHNDIGNFIVYSDAKPLIVDAGVGTYTKKTFGPDRYTIWSMRSEYHNTPIINGYGQSFGGNFRAKAYEYDKATHTLSLDIADAYDSDAGAETYRRTATLANGVVTVTDSFKLCKEGTVQLVLMLVGEPTLGDGVISVGGCEIIYSKELTAAIDTDFDMCAEDGSIKANWNGADMYRVVLTSKKLTEGELFMSVRRKAERKIQEI